MNPESFKTAWQMQSGQTRLTIDADLLVQEVRRNERYFTAMIFWRDVREVGVALLLVPLWFYLGVRMSLPWTWYLTVPVLLWVAAYMLVDRMRHSRRPPEPAEPLRQRVAASLAQVEHQIELLRNILWWYLLPLGLSILGFFSQVAWKALAGGWLTALVIAGLVAVEVIFFAGVYRLNQRAVRAELMPRHQELQVLLMSLQDEPPASSP